MPLPRWGDDRGAADVGQVLRVGRLNGGGGERDGRWRRVKGEGDAGRRFGLPRRLLRATAVESGTVPEASRSAKRTLDAPVARYAVGGDWRSSALGGRRADGPAHTFPVCTLDRRSLPPGEGGGPGAGPRGAVPAGCGIPLRCRRRSSGGAGGGHAVADAQEQLAAFGLDAPGGLEVGLRGGDRIEQGEVDPGLEELLGAPGSERSLA